MNKIFFFWKYNTINANLRQEFCMQSQRVTSWCVWYRSVGEGVGCLYMALVWLTVTESRLPHLWQPAQKAWDGGAMLLDIHAWGGQGAGSGVDTQPPQLLDSSVDWSGSSFNGVDGGVWLSWNVIRRCLLFARSPEDLFFFVPFLNNFLRGVLR